MTSPQPDAHDEFLLRELGAAVSDRAAVPPAARAAAEAAFTWRTVDDDLTMLLCFDSAVDDSVLVRGAVGTAPRNLSFETGEFGLEIEIDAGYVTGQLLPPQPADIRLLTGTGVFAETSADAAGCFVLGHPPRGPIRLQCRAADAVVSTEWMLI